jgi:hypothetical protein
MSVLNINSYIKQPNEVLPIELSFGKLHILPKGASEITDAVASVKRWKRKFPEIIESKNDFLISTTPTILPPNKTKIMITVHGGDSGYDYQVTVLVTFDNGAKLEEDIFVRVREE